MCAFQGASRIFTPERVCTFEAGLDFADSRADARLVNVRKLVKVAPHVFGLFALGDGAAVANAAFYLDNLDLVEEEQTKKLPLVIDLFGGGRHENVSVFGRIATKKQVQLVNLDAAVPVWLKDANGSYIREDCDAQGDPANSAYEYKFSERADSETVILTFEPAEAPVVSQNFFDSLYTIPYLRYQ